jgi:hypothetical protein
MMAKVTSKPNGNGASDAEPATAERQQPSKHEALPRPSSHNCTPEQLIEYWNSIGNEFKQRVWGYLYRLWPLIVRPPRQHFIDKFNEPLESLDSILQQWGTGEYEIRLLDMDKQDSNRPLCKARFKFKESFTECPPVLDIVELDVGRRENETYIQWLRSKGMLRVPGDPQGSNTAENTAVKALADIATKKMEPAESLEGEAATAAFKMMGAATTAAIETVRAQSDPSSLVKLAELLKPAKSDDSLIATILKIQADTQAQTQAILLKLLDRKPEPQPNPTSQLKELAELIKALKDPTTPGSGISHVREIAETVSVLRDTFGRGGKEEWYHAVLNNPEVLDVAKTIGAAAWNWSAAMMQRNSQPLQPPPPTTVATDQQPAPPMNPQPAPHANEETMNVAALGQFLMPRFPAFMEALNSGISGAEFAQELFETRPSLGGMDLGTHAQIKSLGADKIMSLLNMAPPEVKAMLAGRQSMIVKFLNEFLAWEPERDEEIPPPPEG